MEAAAVSTVVDRAKDVALGKLQPWDKNPRRISKKRFEALKESLEQDPLMMHARPLIALTDGRVIAGNMRLRAALELGWTSIRTVFVHGLTEDQARLWALRDNNPYGEWDDDMLAMMVAELARDDINLAMTGFDDDEIARLLKLANPDDEDDQRGKELALADVSIGDPRHVVGKGEVWKLGRHVLLVVSVYEAWEEWVPFLEGDALFVPYPTPTLPLTKRASKTALVMVQPDPWLAGHVIDKFEAVRGADGIERLR